MFIKHLLICLGVFDIFNVVQNPPNSCQKSPFMFLNLESLSLKTINLYTLYVMS